MSWLTNFFSGKPKEPDYPAPADYSFAGTDLHSHLIPGIDDGVKNMDEAVHMIRSLVDLGFKKLITTPHIMYDHYRNTPEIILPGIDKVREAVARAGIPVELEAAAEYYMDEGFMEKLSNNKLLTIGGKYVLVEVSYINPPENLLAVIFDMNVHGYVPLLAHPERYPFWYDKFEEYHRLKDAGVHFIVNTNSFAGYYGLGAKKIAERMVNENLVEFIGSDLHGQRHLEALRSALKQKALAKLAYSGVLNKAL